MIKNLGQIIYAPELIDGEVHFNLGLCSHCKQRVTLTTAGIEEFNKNSIIKLKNPFSKWGKFKTFIMKLMKTRIIITNDARESAEKNLNH